MEDVIYIKSKDLDRLKDEYYVVLGCLVSAKKGCELIRKNKGNISVKNHKIVKKAITTIEVLIEYMENK